MEKAISRKFTYNGLNDGTSILRKEDLKEFSQTFDYVMVFPMIGDTKETQSVTAKYVIHEMIGAGFEIYPYLSVQKDEFIILIRVPLPFLKAFADRIDYKLLVDPAELNNVLTAGDPENRINPIFINPDEKLCKFSPYEHIYLKYGEDIDQALYFTPPGKSNPFVKSIRLKLTNLMIRAPVRDGGCGIEVSKLIHKGQILAFYPMHNKDIAIQIKDKVWSPCTFPWSMPIEDIREYYGEKIALYFVYLGHYSSWLVWPSIIGLGFQLVVWGTLNFSNPVLPFYSLVITIWSIFMLEYWKRQEAETALLWGMSDFEQREQDRPEFRGELIPSPVTGKQITYYPPLKKGFLMRIAQAIISTFIAIVIGVVAGIYVYRVQLQRNSSTYSYASGIASILNTAQITIFNIVYSKVASRLTDFENHRTDTEYEDALIGKLFVFQFINSYASFFFLAFVAAYLDRPSEADDEVLGQCGSVDCMQPLSINLATIFGSRLTITNFLDVFIPWVNHKRKIKKETAGIEEGAALSPAEKDYFLLPYDATVASITNYADTAVQYGFTLLFITALPCASFFSLLNNYIKVKFLIWKHTTFFQRPVPTGVQDIGLWQTIFTIISVAAVITNSGLVFFTMTVVEYDLRTRIWMFIGFQWVLIACQFVASVIVPDTSEDVEIQLERQKFIFDKVIEHVADEEFGTTVEVLEEVQESGVKAAKGCNCFGGKTSSRRVKEFADEVVVLPYPFSAKPDAFPTVLSVTDERLPAVYQTLQSPRNTKKVNTEGGNSYISTTASAAAHVPPAPILAPTPVFPQAAPQAAATEASPARKVSTRASVSADYADVYGSATDEAEMISNPASGN